MEPHVTYEISNYEEKSTYMYICFCNDDFAKANFGDVPKAFDDGHDGRFIDFGSAINQLVITFFQKC